MKKLLLLLVMSCMGAYVMARGPEGDDDAKRGTVEGVVLTSDGTPAAGVSITVENTKYNTLADDGGSFEFKLLPGTYTLVANYIGYAPASQC